MVPGVLLVLSAHASIASWPDRSRRQAALDSNRAPRRKRSQPDLVVARAPRMPLSWLRGLGHTGQRWRCSASSRSPVGSKMPTGGRRTPRAVSARRNVSRCGLAFLRSRDEPDRQGADAAVMLPQAARNEQSRNHDLSTAPRRPTYFCRVWVVFMTCLTNRIEIRFNVQSVCGVGAAEKIPHPRGDPNELGPLHRFGVFALGG